MEIWKPIHSLNDKYEVSENGEIRNAYTKKKLKLFTNRFGYKILTVRPIPNVTVNVRIHRAVAEAFLGVCPEGYVVNHKDGNKANNHVENLEYVTPSQNNQHAIDNGLRHTVNMSEVVVKRGEEHYCAKITESDVRKIIELHKKTGFGCRRLAKITGIPYTTISPILRGISWKHITAEML